MGRHKRIEEVCRKLFHHEYEKCKYFHMTGITVHCSGQLGEKYILADHCWECPKLDARSKSIYKQMMGKD